MKLPSVNIKNALATLGAVAVAGVAIYLMVRTNILPKPLATPETAPVLTATPTTYASERVSFAVEVRDEVIPYRVFGIFVMPGERVDIEPVFSQSGRAASVDAPAGQLQATPNGAWRWTAPGDPGWYPITVTDRSAGEVIRLNAFVMTPFDHQRESLGGFHIGRYREAPNRRGSAFTRPEGFVRVSEENAGVLVAPHFTLGQFASKQTQAFPTYLVLKERLLLKLEMLLEQVNERGIPANTFHILSAFRTPYYNASIGNETRDSVHLYGGAADIFVDMDGDGNMDDLNGDGNVTIADAQFLAEIIERVKGEAWYEPFQGGLSVYDATSGHGPFVHIDVRGEETRW